MVDGWVLFGLKQKVCSMGGVGPMRVVYRLGEKFRIRDAKEKLVRIERAAVFEDQILMV